MNEVGAERERATPAEEKGESGGAGKYSKRAGKYSKRDSCCSVMLHEAEKESERTC